jgi:diguanylate cyclase (GGDEF)-like protein
VLTAKSEHQDLLKALEAGADDFLRKPFDPPELKARLLAGKRVISLQRELIAARERLRYAATHDSLTGLMNRGETIGLLRCELARARREQRSIGIVMADLDHFKKVNDTYGHSAGDYVLKEVSRKLRANLRIYDGLGRFGGEEFLLVMPGCDLATTVQRADALRQQIEMNTIVVPQGSLTVTMSLGVTVAAWSSDASIEVLLEGADKALYQAKNNGRNRVECWGALLQTADALASSQRVMMPVEG